MEQETSVWIFEGMGLEYDQLYKKFQIDSLFTQNGEVVYSLLIEFYVSMFFKHLQWDS